MTGPALPFDPMRPAPPPSVTGDDLPDSLDPNDITEAPSSQDGAFAFEDAIRAELGLDAGPPPEIVPDTEAVLPEADGPDADALAAEDKDLQQKAIRALYGHDCPLLDESPDGPQDADWARWAAGLWDRHRAAMAPILRNAALNRLFRQGRQWVSWRGGEYREPPAPRDEARVVHNMIRPALALRQQVVSEQRPGFRMQPAQQTPGAEKKAEAQQRAVEYQYEQQDMEGIIREAAHWAGTDGVSFLYSEWDVDRGPWDEASETREKLGELKTCVLRIEQVRVSANATATEAPYYWVTKRQVSLAEAVARHGPQVAGTRDPAVADAIDALSMPSSSSVMGGASDSRQGMPPTQLLLEQETVDEYSVYCAPLGSVLPQGFMLRVVGDVVVYADVLPWGVVPLVRWADGSEDPAFFPAPLMDDWRDHQKRINALISKVIENIRINAHGRLLTRPGAITGETLVGGVLSLIEVKGPPGEAVTPLAPFSIAQDVLAQIQFEVAAFEQKSGWNDTTRGSFSSDQSGRAILAAREQVERIFTPPVAAAADAMVAWAEVQCHGMRWGYDLPRHIGATGGDRPDLALAISSEEFDGICEVGIDPETMMPLPRSMRLFLLDQMLEKGLLTPQEYRQRMPFAFVGSITTPNARQEARAHRVSAAIIQSAKGEPVAVPDLRWTDDEGVQQSVLQADILDVDKPDDPAWPMIVAAAMQRWIALANQAAQKQGGAPPMLGAGGAGGPAGGPGGAEALDPTAQPLAANNPGVASAPAGVMMAEDDESAARAADGLLGM